MAELAWITLGKHRQFGLTASTIHDDFGSVHRLLLDAGFITGHPDFAYVLGNTHPDEVRVTLQQLYNTVASHYVAIDDALLDEGMSKNPAPPRGSEPARQLAPAPSQPDARADLAEFAEVLSALLPGSWTVALHEHGADGGQIPLSGRVWDYGHVRWAFCEFTTRRSVVLTSDSGIELLVTDRPLRKHELLVAAFEPRGTGFDTTTKTPNGIVVSNDPVRAASRVTTRLLPRYQEAVRVTGSAGLPTPWLPVSAFSPNGTRSRTACATPSTGRSTSGMACASRSGTRRCGRSSLPSSSTAPALVAHAEQTLPLLDLAEGAAGQWAYWLRSLREALAGGARVQAEFQVVAEALLPDRPRSNTVFADVLSVRNTEGWHYALTF